MPELPEVETIVRDLAKILPRKKFSDVVVRDPFVLRQPPQNLIRRLKGRAIEAVTRRGKALIVHLSGGKGFLVVQLMMTGQLVFNGQEDNHTRLVFIFSDASRLLYNDQRKFGQIRAVQDLKEIKHFHILGPEPFSKDFSLPWMRQAFQKSRRPIKNLLLDHTFVAGIGNIYASEILFRSRISPLRPALRLTTAETRALHGAITDVLQEAITHRGSSMRNYRDSAGEKGRFNRRLAVYGRKGTPCRRCGAAIRRIVQAGRSTFYCGKCQK